jgi:hypothetical protein
MILALLACVAEYTVDLEPRTATPVPVVLSPRIEMPAGVVVIAGAEVRKNDEVLDDLGDLVFSTDDPDILEIAPVTTDDGELEWALVAVSPGSTTLRATVDGHSAEPIDAEIEGQ